MIDTAPAADNAQNRTTLAGAPGNQDAVYIRPAPRAAKEKKYRELLKRKQTLTPVPLHEYLLGMVQMVRSLDGEARKQHNRDIATFYQYYDGNEYGEFDESGQWISDAQNSEEFAYSLPITPAHVDAAKTLLTKVHLEYEYAAKNDVSVLDGQLARMCEKLAEEEMERIMSDDLRALERLYLLLAGKSYRCHFWAGNPLEPNTVEIPVYENGQVDVPGSRVCGNPECQTPVGLTDTVCPKCLSDKITDVGGGKTVKMERRMQTQALAQNQVYVPNPLAVQHDLSKTNINRSFLVERDTLPRSEAEFLYCQTFAGKRGGLSEEMTMIRELERTRLRTGQNLGSDASIVKSLFTADLELVERERVWLESWRCANFVITEDRWFVSKKDGLVWCDTDEEVPQDARPVKAGTFFGDIYPTGGFICVVDDEVVEINGGQVSDKWVKIVFGIRPGTSEGSGMQRLRPLADMANDSTNLEFKVLMDDADPKTFLNRAYLSHLAKVGEYNIVDQLKNDDGWDKVVHRLEGAASHPALGLMSERVQAMAQFLVGTVSSLGQGAPDIKAFGTATGVVAMAEEASGRFVDPILQIAIADIESRFKILNNIKKFSIDPQIADLRKRFGAEVVTRFMQCNLRNAVAIKKKKGTDQPQSQAIKLAQLQAYGDAASKVGDNPNAVSLLESFAEMIDLPITVGLGLADKEEAGRRLGVLRDLTQKFNDQSMQPEHVVMEALAVVVKVTHDSENDVPASMALQSHPPMAAGPMPANDDDLAINQAAGAESALAPGPPVTEEPEQRPEVPSVIMMQEHPVFMDAFKDWLLTEGARCNNVVLKTSVQMMWKLHYEREIVKNTEIQRVEGEKQLQVEQMKAKAAQALAPPPMPPPPPMAKISESISYDNAPSDIKRQIETAAGLQPSQEVEPAGDDGTAGVVGDVMTRVADEHAKDAEFEREQKGKDADLDREASKMELQSELNREAQAEAAKNEPKGGTEK
jgi:hypothetical protein